MTEKQIPTLKRLIKNPVSIAGFVVFSLATFLGLPMLFIDIFSRSTNPYAGIFTYLILPGCAAIGVLIILAGLIWERSRLRRRPETRAVSLPRLDLNNPRHRIILVSLLGGVLVVIFLLTITGYRAYQFSDSVQFCGLSCHSVMKPEYTTYQHSPHARVACVSCHIGPGVSWFVKSKITGAYQIYSVAFKKYHRPIETPVKDLRPAQETCEKCHWPAKFFGAQQKIFSHYLTNTETNKPWQIQMLIKTGGGNPKLGEASGIHWHMNIKNKIEYIATDENRNVIPWVRSTDPEGRVTEYVSAENTLTPEERAAHEIRRLDCIDCHNRPSHIFHPPDQAVNEALHAALIDGRLPFIKREAVRVLSAPYSTEAEALAAISKEIPDFYQTHYPKIFAEKSDSIQTAVSTIRSIFSRNIFPEMKTDWRAHINHLTHFTSDGCYRCHDGQHISSDGKAVTNDCHACHTILAQGPPDKLQKVTLKSQEFQHPVDVGVDVTTMKCTLCHSGSAGM